MITESAADKQLFSWPRQMKIESQNTSHVKCLILEKEFAAKMHFIFAQSDGKFQETCNGSRLKVIHSHVTLVMALTCFKLFACVLLHFNLLYNKYLILLFLNSNCLSTLSMHDDHFQFSLSLLFSLLFVFVLSILYLSSITLFFFLLFFLTNSFLFC